MVRASNFSAVCPAQASGGAFQHGERGRVRHMGVEGGAGAREVLLEDPGMDVKGGRLRHAVAGHHMAVEVADQQAGGGDLGESPAIRIHHQEQVVPARRQRKERWLQMPSCSPKLAAIRKQAARSMRAWRTASPSRSELRRMAGVVGVARSIGPWNFFPVKARPGGGTTPGPLRFSVGRRAVGGTWPVRRPRRPGRRAGWWSPGCG